VVYSKLGLAILRKAWLNLNLVWAAALVVTSVLTLLMYPLKFWRSRPSRDRTGKYICAEAFQVGYSVGPCLDSRIWFQRLQPTIPNSGCGGSDSIESNSKHISVWVTEIETQLASIQAQHVI
jgi:hypothetical protein